VEIHFAKTVNADHIEKQLDYDIRTTIILFQLNACRRPYYLAWTK